MRRRFFLSGFLTVGIAGLLAAAPFAFAQNENQGAGQATVTVLPKHTSAPPGDVSREAVEITVNGQKPTVSVW